MTMGALHEGHAALVRQALHDAGPGGSVVVTRVAETSAMWRTEEEHREGSRWLVSFAAWRRFSFLIVWEAGWVLGVQR